MDTIRHDRPTHSVRSTRSWIVTLLAGPALMLALAGCTPGSSGDAAPTPTGSSTSGQAGSDAETSAARDAYDRKLAECFRAQGLDVKDPLPGKGITEEGPEIQEAYPACAAEIGDPPASSDKEVTPEFLKLLLERAKCLRELGNEVQEPTLEDPGFISAEVSDEDFEKCRI
jgi:hypothetical protein